MPLHSISKYIIPRESTLWYYEFILLQRANWMKSKQKSSACIAIRFVAHHQIEHHRCLALLAALQLEEWPEYGLNSASMWPWYNARRGDGSRRSWQVVNWGWQSGFSAGARCCRLVAWLDCSMLLLRAPQIHSRRRRRRWRSRRRRRRRRWSRLQEQGSEGSCRGCSDQLRLTSVAHGRPARQEPATCSSSSSSSAAACQQQQQVLQLPASTSSSISSRLR